jgi:hypothetical protein
VPLVAELPRVLLPRSYQTGFRKGVTLYRSARLCPRTVRRFAGPWRRPVLLASLRLGPCACPI